MSSFCKQRTSTESKSRACPVHRSRRHCYAPSFSTRPTPIFPSFGTVMTEPLLFWVGQSDLKKINCNNLKWCPEAQRPSSHLQEQSPFFGAASEHPANSYLPLWCLQKIVRGPELTHALKLREVEDKKCNIHLRHRVMPPLSVRSFQWLTWTAKKIKVGDLVKSMIGNILVSHIF